MKLELKKEYSPTLNDFVYRIYVNDDYVATQPTLEQADKLLDEMKDNIKVPPEIIRTVEI